MPASASRSPTACGNLSNGHASHSHSIVAALPLCCHRRRVRLRRRGRGHSMSPPSSMPTPSSGCRRRCAPAAVARFRAPRPAAGQCRAGDGAMGAWRWLLRGRLGAHRGRRPRRTRASAALLRPLACTRAATLASAPAPKYNDKRAEQPVAAENPRLPHLTYPTTIRLARLKRLSFGPATRTALPPAGRCH